MSQFSRCFIITILALLYSFVGYTNEYSTNTISQSLKDNAYAVIRLDSSRIEIKNNGFVQRSTYIITILSAEGDQFATFASDYNSYSSFEKITAIQYNEDGKEVKKAHKSDIIDISAFGTNYAFLQDDRYKIFDFNCRTYPYTVKFEYEKKFKSLFFLPNWQPQSNANIAVEKAVFEIVYQGENPVRHKSVNFNASDHFHADTSNPKKQIYQWTFTNLNAFEYQPYSRTFLLKKPTVELFANKIQLDDYEGPATTWKDFGTFFYNLNRDKEILSEKNVAQVAELTKGVTDKKKKVELLYKYLQKNTRYVLNSRGILGWQSISANDVHQTGYGDCKGLSNYMKAILKAVNITAYQTLVYAGDKLGHTMDMNFPTNTFNHVILCVPLEKDTIWLECTSNLHPTGYLSEFTHDRTVLVLTENGGQIAKTPRYNKNESSIERQISLNLDVNQSTQNINWQSEYTGNMAKVVLEYAINKPKKVYEDYISSAVPYKNSKLKEVKSESTISAANIPVVNEMATYEVEHLITETKSRYLLSLPLIQTGIPDIETKSTRTEPFVFGSDFKLSYLYTIVYPDSLVPENVPKAIAAQHPFGSYSYKPTVSGNKILFHIELLINEGTYSPELYNNYQQFYKTAINNTKQITLSFLKK